MFKKEAFISFQFKKFANFFFAFFMVSFIIMSSNIYAKECYEFQGKYIGPLSLENTNAINVNAWVYFDNSPEDEEKHNKEIIEKVRERVITDQIFHYLWRKGSQNNFEVFNFYGILKGEEYEDLIFEITIKKIPSGWKVLCCRVRLQAYTNSNTEINTIWMAETEGGLIKNEQLIERISFMFHKLAGQFVHTLINDKNTSKK